LPERVRLTVKSADGILILPAAENPAGGDGLDQLPFRTPALSQMSRGPRRT